MGTAAETFKSIEPRAPPRSEIGAWGWVRRNFFAGPVNSALTVLVLALLALALPPLFNWAVLYAVIAPDNVVVHVGNNKMFSDNIHNFTTNPYRRVDLTAQLAHSVDPADAIGRLRIRLNSIPNVLASPAPEIDIGAFNERGAVLVVRPYTANDHYWQVFFDANRIIRDTFAEAGYPVPEEHVYERT